MHQVRSLAVRFALVAFLTGIASAMGAQLEFPYVPDESMTRGSLCTTSNPDFSQYRYREKIPYCKRNVSTSTKNEIYNAYGVPRNCRGEYTIDHFIPLSLGGNNTRANLWPEHKAIKALRQNLETELYEDLSSGRITQAEAIRAIRDAKWDPPVENLDHFDPCL